MHLLRSIALLSLPTLACVGNPPPPALEAAVAELSAPGCTAKLLTAFSTDADEGRLVYSTDGKTAFFHRGLANGPQIFESHKIGGVWSTPVAASFGSGFVEFDPYLTIDGKTLYYTSYRPITGTAANADAEIWKVSRTASGAWGAPVHLGPEVNAAGSNEHYPSLTADGTLYFNSDRAGGVGSWDIYQAKKRGNGFAPAVVLPGDVNTDIWEYNPSLTPLGGLLAFGSLDPDPAAPYSDVFFAVRLPGGYSERVNAGPCVNTEIEEYHPQIDWPRARMTFVRWTPATQGDLYEVSLPATLLSLVD